MKARTARNRRMYRYMLRVCETRPDSLAAPCLERWYDREVTRFYARMRNERPIPVMPARAWYRKGMDQRLEAARAEAEAEYAEVWGWLRDLPAKEETG